jgi:hypothetical protein
MGSGEKIAHLFLFLFLFPVQIVGGIEVAVDVTGEEQLRLNT